MRAFKKIITFTLAGICVFSSALAAESSENIGRYITVLQKPLSAQRDLLSQTIQIRFPNQINTVGAAITHLLRYSGYSLVAKNQTSPALKNTLQKSLPLVDRELGPITLRDALITLAGPAFTLAEDPLNREVNFHLKPAFSKKMHHGDAL